MAQRGDGLDLGAERVLEGVVLALRTVQDLHGHVDAVGRVRALPDHAGAAPSEAFVQQVGTEGDGAHGTWVGAAASYSVWGVPGWQAADPATNAGRDGGGGGVWGNRLGFARVCGRPGRSRAGLAWRVSTPIALPVRPLSDGAPRRME